MLDKIIENGLYDFYDEATDWKDAIEKSCKTLIEKNIVGENYPKEIIKTVEKYGPYIVLIPEVAMPHCQECAEGVNSTAISFMKLKKPVCFDDEDREKDARIFFTVASNDNKLHLENIAQLSDVLCRDEVVNDLLEVNTIEDLIEVQKKYNI